MSTTDIAILKETEKAKQKQLNQDFIPISCHYDQNILITKSGDLLVTIMIDGSNDSTTNEKPLRASLQAALSKAIDTYKISAHIHTAREFRNISPKGVIPFGFPAAINTAWNKYHAWDKQLVNTLYVTLIYQGPRIGHLSTLNISSKLIKSKFEHEWEVMAAHLHQASNNICESLKDLGAKKLGITVTKNGSVSEPLSFYYYLTHFKESQVFAPMNDLSSVLNDFDVTYGFNKMQIKSNQSNSYVAIFTLKESINAPDSFYNKLLQSQVKFVISESLVFADKIIATEHFKKNMDILEMGRSQRLADVIGLTSAVNNDNGNVTDYAKYQINIVLYNDSEESLQENILRASKLFREMGLVVVREDFNMAKCLWSIMPGNFRFFCRQNYGSMNHLLNFSQLHDSNLGNKGGSIWGPTISLFKTLTGSPFYFNFHHKNNGNTILIGPKGSGKTSLVQFLITQSVKLDPSVIYIDASGANENFIKKMGGSYFNIALSTESPIQAFPFDTDLFYGDKEAMRSWLLDAIIANNGNMDSTKKLVDTLIENILSLSSVEARRNAFSGIIRDMSSNEEAKNMFSGLMKEEVYYSLFSDAPFKSPMGGDIIAFNISTIEDIKLREVYLKIILLKLSTITKPNTIIVVNKAASLLECEYFSGLLPSITNSIENKNSILVLEVEHTRAIQSNPKVFNAIQSFGTQIYMTDHIADKSFKFTYHLSDEDWRSIKAGAVELRRFLIKQGDVSATTSFYMPEISNMLSEQKK